MNRRTFLGILGGSAAAFALDPDLALWVPGRRTFFLPPDRAIVTATESDIEALMAAVGGGPFMVLPGFVRPPQQIQTDTVRTFRFGAPGQPPVFGMPSSPEQVIKAVSNEEYRLLVARGHRILASRREVVRPVFGANGQLLPAERAEALRARGWTLSDDRSPRRRGDSRCRPRLRPVRQDD